MKYRRFGATELDVSEIGFGGSRIGGMMTRGAPTVGLATLRAAFDAGVNFYDTADMYSQGESEALIGQAFRDRRDKVIIASKGGYRLPARRHLLARIKPLLRPIVRALGIKRENLPSGLSGQLAQDFSPRYLTGAVEGSLRRLRTDYLDLYQLHSPSREVIASDVFLDALQTLEKLKTEGKIRYVGLAADSLDDASSSDGRAMLHSVQVPFGLLDPDRHNALRSWRERGIGVISRGCYGGGLLKESLTEADLRQRTPKADWILGLRRFAQERERSLLEVALQYALRTPGVGVTILGMHTLEHVRENLRHYAGAPLSDDELAACDQAAPPV